MRQAAKGDAVTMVNELLSPFFFIIKRELAVNQMIEIHELIVSGIYYPPKNTTTCACVVITPKVLYN